MSIQAIEWVIGNGARRRGLTGPTGADRLVLISLANHASDEWAWPSIALIAQEANVTERTVHSSLSRLIEGGYVERTVNGAPADLVPDPQYRPNLYRLNFAAESPGVEIDADQGLKSTHGRGGKPPRSEPATPSVRTITGTVEEPSLDPGGSSGVAMMTEGEAFDAFWRAYPRKASKKAAREKFGTAFRRHGVLAISAGSKKWRAWWTASSTPKDLIPYPATWLHQERFLDDPADVHEARGQKRAAEKRDHVQELMSLEFDAEGNLL